MNIDGAEFNVEGNEEKMKITIEGSKSAILKAILEIAKFLFFFR